MEGRQEVGSGGRNRHERKRKTKEETTIPLILFKFSPGEISTSFELFLPVLSLRGSLFCILASRYRRKCGVNEESVASCSAFVPLQSRILVFCSFQHFLVSSRISSAFSRKERAASFVHRFCVALSSYGLPIIRPARILTIDKVLNRSWFSRVFYFEFLSFLIFFYSFLHLALEKRNGEKAILHGDLLTFWNETKHRIRSIFFCWTRPENVVSYSLGNWRSTRYDNRAETVRSSVSIRRYPKLSYFPTIDHALLHETRMHNTFPILSFSGKALLEQYEKYNT